MDLVLTTVQKAIVAKLSAPERKAFDDLSTSEKEGYLVALSFKDVAIDESKFASVKGLTSVPMIAVKTENNPLGIVAGTVIKGKLVGYEFMFSEKEQPNWKQVRGEDGKMYYSSGYYKLLKDDGTVFGIYDYAQLHEMKRIPTSATNPSNKNPEVLIKYIGLIEGKERLSKEFGIEIKTGTKAHVFDVRPEVGIELIKRSGIHNALNSYLPTANLSDKDLTEQEVSARNWNDQVQAHIAYNNSQRAIEGSAPTEISQ